MSWFAEALARRGLRFEAVAHGDYSYESGYKEAALLLQPFQPDALISANDVMAIGVQDAARQLGLSVPEDLALVGHDGVSLAGWDCHAITSIAPSSSADHRRADRFHRPRPASAAEAGGGARRGELAAQHGTIALIRRAQLPNA